MMLDMSEHPQPYSPSWIDRLTSWVRRLPVPVWAFYLALWIALLLLALISMWAGGKRPTRVEYLFYSLAAFSIAYLPALIHYLDQSAGAALARFRLVMMDVDEDKYASLRYQMTTLPARPALIAPLLGAIYALGAIFLAMFLGLGPVGIELPAATPLNVTYRALVSALAALIAYHTLHQLRLVSLIYTRHTRINLFQQGPLYALSNLAALSAIGISIPTTLWYWLISSASSSLALPDLFSSIFFAAIIVVTFVWPLAGAHRLLEREKQRLLDEVGRRMEATIQQLHGQIDAGELGTGRGALAETLNGLMIEQGVIQKLRTWPWQTGAAGSVGVALLAPLVIWLIQRLLSRLGI